MDFLTKNRRGEPPGVLVAFGDSGLLHQHAQLTIKKWVLGSEASEFAYSPFRGDSAIGREVLDELFTPPFTGGKRLVVVEDADDFVSQNRPALEKVVASPSKVGVLFLAVKSWPATTRLAKAIELAIDCNSPKPHFVAGWCVKWCSVQHQKTLDRSLADWLVELVGTELGILDQELAKLATAAGSEPAISRESIEQLVAGSRVDTAFAMLDAALEGNIPHALKICDRLMVSGEHPVGLLAMMAAHLRKLAASSRAIALGQPIDQAMKNAGVLPFHIDRASKQFKRLGPSRASRLYRRLLKTDLDLKGGTALSGRIVLERFLIALGRTTS